MANSILKCLLNHSKFALIDLKDFIEYTDHDNIHTTIYQEFFDRREIFQEKKQILHNIPSILHSLTSPKNIGIHTHSNSENTPHRSNYEIT